MNEAAIEHENALRVNTSKGKTSFFSWKESSCMKISNSHYPIIKFVDIINTMVRRNQLHLLLLEGIYKIFGIGELRP